jgi:hypothetical protein
MYPPTTILVPHFISLCKTLEGTIMEEDWKSQGIHVSTVWVLELLSQFQQSKDQRQYIAQEANLHSVILQLLNSPACIRRCRPLYTDLVAQYYVKLVRCNPPSIWTQHVRPAHVLRYTITSIKQRTGVHKSQWTVTQIKQSNNVHLNMHTNHSGWELHHTMYRPY